MNDVAQQVVQSPAEVYDEYFVPALFQQWGSIVTDAAGVAQGDRVLDVACGTGALTRAAADRAGAAGHVTGLDPNEAMLEVARRKDTRIEWQTGVAESLPFADECFDRVVSQFGLMFFEDKPAALREIARVLRPGGRLAIAVCDALDHSPGYAVFAELLHRLFGADVAQAFRAPFSMGDREELLSLGSSAPIDNVRVQRHDGRVRFNSIGSLVSTERACVWTLGGVLGSGQFERLLHESEESLQPFEADDGTIEFLMPALILTGDKP